MRVLVRIDMREAQPAGLCKGNLRGCFRLDFCGADAACEQAQQKGSQLGGKQPVAGSTSVGTFSGGSTGWPSTRTMWHPTPRVAFCAASARASAVASARAIKVVLVRTPLLCSSTMARLTPARQAEVIGIYDQATHGMSVSIRYGALFRMNSFRWRWTGRMRAFQRRARGCAGGSGEACHRNGKGWYHNKSPHRLLPPVGG